MRTVGTRKKYRVPKINMIFIQLQLYVFSLCFIFDFWVSYLINGQMGQKLVVRCSPQLSCIRFPQLSQV